MASQLKAKPLLKHRMCFVLDFFVCAILHRTLCQSCARLKAQDELDSKHRILCARMRCVHVSKNEASRNSMLKL